MTRQRNDDGVAALELGLLLTVMLLLLALVTPLAYLFYERVQLGRAAGDVIRFASSRTDGDRLVQAFDTSGATQFVVPGAELPGPDAIAAESALAYAGRGTIASPVVLRAADTTCPSGFRLTITLSAQVDVGPFVSLLEAAKLTSGPNETLTAQASSCEE